MEKRYDPRSFKDGGVEKIPEKHLGPKLAAMERQGYASTEGVHNGKVDADHAGANYRAVPEEPASRHAAHCTGSRGSRSGGRRQDEMVTAEAKELRQLTSDYLLNERFLIGHTRRKALHQARKRTRFGNSCSRADQSRNIVRNPSVNYPVRIAVDDQASWTQSRMVVKGPLGGQ